MCVCVCMRAREGRSEIKCVCVCAQHFVWSHTQMPYPSGASDRFGATFQALLGF